MIKIHESCILLTHRKQPPPQGERQKSKKKSFNNAVFLRRNIERDQQDGEDQQLLFFFMPRLFHFLYRSYGESRDKIEDQTKNTDLSNCQRSRNFNRKLNPDFIGCAMLLNVQISGFLFLYGESDIKMETVRSKNTATKLVLVQGKD